jgi:hypothetical protein
VKTFREVGDVKNDTADLCGNQEEYRLPKLSDISSTRARRQLKVCELAGPG